MSEEQNKSTTPKTQPATPSKPVTTPATPVTHKKKDFSINRMIAADSAENLRKKGK